MKILVVKLHALGDLVIASPAIRRLKEGILDAQIDLLTTAWTAPAMLNNSLIDNIIAVRNELFFKPGLGTIAETIGLINGIRRGNYDLAVIFHLHKGIDYFIRLTGIKQRYMFSSTYENEGIYLDPGRHSALTACELADYAVFQTTRKRMTPANLPQLRYEWHILDEENSQALSILNTAGIKSGDFSLLLPGGGVSPGIVETERRWKAAGFAEVAEYIYDKYNSIPVLLGGSSDRAVCDEVSKLSKVDCINLAGLYNMRLSAAIMSQSSLIVTNDSGPLHVAAALGIPTVGVFGPTGVALKLPPGDNVQSANLGIPCSPCYFGRFKGCIFDNLKCFDELHSDVVNEAVARAMNDSAITVS